LRLADLPDDIIYVLLKFCDVKTLGRLAQVCRRLSVLISRDCVWLSVKGRLTCVFDSRPTDWFVISLINLIVVLHVVLYKI